MPVLLLPQVYSPAAQLLLAVNFAGFQGRLGHAGLHWILVNRYMTARGVQEIHHETCARGKACPWAAASADPSARCRHRCCGGRPTAPGAAFCQPPPTRPPASPNAFLKLCFTPIGFPSLDHCKCPNCDDCYTSTGHSHFQLPCLAYWLRFQGLTGSEEPKGFWLKKRPCLTGTQ